MPDSLKPETSFSNFHTAYDDAFKTMLSECTRLIIPVVNIAFDEHYTGNEQIVRSSADFYIHTGDDKLSRVSADSVFTIFGIVRKNYHIECQSTDDGTILIRMFEYDTQVALEDSSLEDNVLTVRFPHSAILYLRDTSITPDNSTIRIETPDGSLSYRVRNIKVKQYTIDELFEKNLLFLIPFHIFTFEHSFEKINESEQAAEGLKEYYSEIRRRLDELATKGYITEYEKHAILEMSRRVLLALTRKHGNVRKGAGDGMGGVVLDFEAKRIHDDGIKIGESRGIEIGEGIGEERYADLNARLVQAGRLDDLARAATDKEYRKALFAEFDL